MKIRVKNDIDVECFSGMSSGVMYVKKGCLFEDVKYVDGRYGGDDGYYEYEDEYFGDLVFMKDDVEVVE